MKDTAAPSTKRKRKKPTVSGSRKRASEPDAAGRPRPVARGRKGQEPGWTPAWKRPCASRRLIEAQAAWRAGVPHLSDRTLRALATQPPWNSPGVACRPGNRDQHRGEIRAGYLPRHARERRLTEKGESSETKSLSSATSGFGRVFGGGTRRKARKRASGPFQTVCTGRSPESSEKQITCGGLVAPAIVVFSSIGSGPGASSYRSGQSAARGRIVER